MILGRHLKSLVMPWHFSPLLHLFLFLEGCFLPFHQISVHISCPLRVFIIVLVCKILNTSLIMVFFCFSLCCNNISWKNNLFFSYFFIFPDLPIDQSFNLLLNVPPSLPWLLFPSYSFILQFLESLLSFFFICSVVQFSKVKQRFGAPSLLVCFPSPQSMATVSLYCLFNTSSLPSLRWLSSSALS